MTARAAGQRYIAFLRAINVGGRTLKMTALKRIFEQAGFADVETFIASGNVIFSSAVKDSARLEASIDRALQAALGYPVVTFIRTPGEVAKLATCDPFGKPIPPGGRLFVGFLRTAPAAAVRRKVATLATATDEFCIAGRELYWLCAVPSMQSIRSAAQLEKTLGAPATLRNLNTVRRLALKYPAP
jgi:uncharacterized protein (DUF1697 family)